VHATDYPAHYGSTDSMNKVTVLLLASGCYRRSLFRLYPSGPNVRMQQTHPTARFIIRLRAEQPDSNVGMKD